MGGPDAAERATCRQSGGSGRGSGCCRGASSCRCASGRGAGSCRGAGCGRRYNCALGAGPQPGQLDRIYDAGGAALYHGLARSESQHRVAGSAPLRLFLGNPMAVSLELNGRPVELRGTTAASRPRHFSLDSVGHVIDIDGHLKAD